MKTASAISLIFSFLCAAALPTAVFAQSTSSTDQPKAAVAQEAVVMTDGEVKKIDKELGKITLKHAEIQNLDMPGMTMVFTVQDKTLLDRVRPGDKVKFHAISENGKLIVTDIQPAK